MAPCPRHSMTRQEGDPCPRCKTGKLTVDPDRDIHENEDGSSGSHRTWLCDSCGHKTRDFVRGVVDSVDVSDDVSGTKRTSRGVTDSVDVSDNVE